METAPKGRFPVNVSLASGSQALVRRMMMVLDLVLVATRLAVELVHQLVDRGVQVFV